MSRADVLVSADWAEQNLATPGASSSRSTKTPRPMTAVTSPVPSSWTGSPTCRTRCAGTSSARSSSRSCFGEGHRQRRHRGPLRRQQQLVRRVRLLVLQAVRPRQREAARRRPQEVGARRPGAVQGRRRAGRRRRTPAKDQDTAIRAFRDEAIAAIGSKNLVDVRSPDEFSGKLLAPAHLPQEQSQRAGTSRPRSTSRGARRPTRTARSSPTTSCASSTPTPAWTTARTPSRTAGSASGPATPGSPCTSCSATRTSRTTTARGPSTARSSASRSRRTSDMCGAPAQTPDVLPPDVDLSKETVIYGVVSAADAPVPAAYVRLLDCDR